MGALLDLWKSERGLVAVALIVAATTLCGLGIIDVTGWLDYTKWIFVTYAAAKTVTGAVGIATKAPSPPPVWQQLEPLITSIVATLATERAQAKSDAPEDPPTPTPPVSIVPPPQAV